MKENIIGEGGEGKIIKHDKNVALYIFMILTSYHELKNFTKSILYVRTIIN